jgi:hypothetical protein
MVSSLAVPHVAGPSYPQCNTCFVVRACARGESLMRERGCFGFHVTEMHTLQRGATTYLNRATPGHAPATHSSQHRSGSLGHHSPPRHGQARSAPPPLLQLPARRLRRVGHPGRLGALGLRRSPAKCVTAPRLVFSFEAAFHVLGALVCRCRGSPVLVVLQEPAEDVDAGEAVADRPLAAGGTGKH